MLEHQELFEQQKKRAAENLNLEKVVFSVNSYFLGCLGELLYQSKDGNIKAEDIAYWYKRAVDHAMEQDN